MRSKAVSLLVLLSGCDAGPPPLDQLPLRDTLRADPAVVALLSDDARAKLADRFEAAPSKDLAIDDVAVIQATPASLVVKLDSVREQRGDEALVLGISSHGAAWSLRDRTAPQGREPLPALAGDLAGDTQRLENRALHGRADVPLRALMAATGAQHLYRVVGWPVGAIAIDDTIYVNASWLVSLAPGDEVADGGRDAERMAPGSGTANLVAGPSSSQRAPTPLDTPLGEGRSGPGWSGPALDGSVSTYRRDAGTARPPSPSDTSGDAYAESCASACVDSCAGQPAEEDDSCDGDDSSGCEDVEDDGDDSNTEACAGTDEEQSDACTSSDGEQDACASTSEDTEAAECRMARRRGRPSSSTELWLMAPLAFLLLRRRP